LIASQFAFLVGTAPIDDLVALAENFNRNGGWPQGWAGVLGGLRKARNAKWTDIAIKLEPVEAQLKPVSLSERIATYVLPREWGPLDVAEMDLTDPEKYEKRRKQAISMCETIGSELAKDLDAFAAHLPEMLVAQSSKGLIVASAVGRETAEPSRAWEIICKEALSPAHNGKMFTFPGAFLSGLSETNRALVETLLDEVLTATTMSPFLVHMQVSVGLDKRGCERLIKATKLNSVPTHSFNNLVIGRATDALSGGDLENLLLAIADREEGLEVAIEILHSRVFLRTSAGRSPGDAERQTARALLSKVTFEKNSQGDIYHLSEIAKTCLAAPEDNDLGKQVCERLCDAINGRKAWAWNYGELVSELASLFPRTVLEAFVERNGEEDHWPHRMFEQFSARRPNPLSRIDDICLLDWAHEKPTRRFPQLAEVIRPWKNEKDDGGGPSDQEAGQVLWTVAAKRLIHEAPEPLVVLDIFRTRFGPSGWSGSLADILTSRLPLLQQLTTDSDQEIAKWAREAIPSLEKQVEEEREREAYRHRIQDDRFEW